MNIKNIIILIVAGVLIFLIGGGLGILSQTQSKVEKVKTETVNNLASKVVSSIVAYGQVKNISGRDITLSNLGDDLVISVANNAPVYAFTTVKSKTGVVSQVQQVVGFEIIKIGDKINSTIKLLSTGKFEGESVIILPK